MYSSLNSVLSLVRTNGGVAEWIQCIHKRLGFLLAARRVAKRNPNLLWMHWIHSATPPFVLTKERTEFKDEYINLVNESFPNSFYICFNDYSVHRISQNFHTEMDRVKVIHHPTDIYDLYKFEPRSIEFSEKHKLLQADIICVY